MVNSTNNTQIGFGGPGQKKVSMQAEPNKGFQQTMMNDTSFTSQMGRPAKERIGPFSFDIDDEIDTEILTSEEVYKDLKELEKILDKDKDKINITSKSFGRSKKKSNRKLY